MEIILSFCFFIALMIFVGAISTARKKAASNEYLNAGRTHGKFIIALSGAASATSGFVMIGAVGAGYTMGFLAVLMPISWFLGDFIFWTLFPDRINRQARDTQSNTIPEFVSYQTIGQRDAGIRKFLAMISIVFVGLYAVGQFLAAGKAVNAAFDLPMSSAIIISGLIILAYSAKGGLQSSIPTQFVQALIMLFTTIGMLILAVVIGGGPIQLINDLNAIDPTMLSFDGGLGLVMVCVFILGFASTAFAFSIGQPQLLVRIMATKSPEEAAKTRWIYLGFMQLTWVSMSLFGMAMKVLMPDLTDPEQALPLFAMNNLSPILAGAVLAGIFAAVASTLDALLLVLSSLVGVDLSPKFYKKMTSKFGVRYQVFITVIVALITGLIAVLLVGNTTVFTIIVFSSTALGVTVGCAMFLSVCGWKTTAPALTASVICALLVAILWRYFGLSSMMLEGFPAFLTGLSVNYLLMKTGVMRVSKDCAGNV